MDVLLELIVWGTVLSVITGVVLMILAAVYQYMLDRYEENDVDPFDKGDHIA